MWRYTSVRRTRFWMVMSINSEITTTPLAQNRLSRVLNTQIDNASFLIHFLTLNSKYTSYHTGEFLCRYRNNSVVRENWMSLAVLSEKRIRSSCMWELNYRNLVAKNWIIQWNHYTCIRKFVMWRGCSTFRGSTLQTGSGFGAIQQDT